MSISLRLSWSLILIKHSRYLRARRFVPQDALGQFQDTEKWREANEIDNLYENIDVEAYEETRKLVCYWRYHNLLGKASNNEI